MDEMTDIASLTARAKKAQKVWSMNQLSVRTAFCDRLIDILRHEKRAREIVEVIFQETGTPRDEIDSVEIGDVMFVAHYYARNAKRILRKRAIRTHPFFRVLKKTTVLRKPRGVVAIIAPVNFPFCFALDDAIPALIAGNAVIVKPAEQNPNSARVAKQLLEECGLPPDLYQVTSGEPSVGAELVAHPSIDMVCFTGSTETGRAVAMACAKRLIPASLELSGKAPAIVFADAPLRRAAKGIVWGSFFHSGQDCVSIERVYVHEDIHGQFVEAAVKETKQLRFERDLGPLFTTRQQEKVKEHVDDAVSKGAQVACGGAIVGKGYLPTILTGVTESMAVAKEESFGPLLPILSFRDTDEVIASANASAYGLQATLWTRDKRIVERCLAELEVGNVCVNDGLINFTMVETPFGGIKQSGIGSRHGEEGLTRFTTEMTVVDTRIPIKSELYWFPYTPAKGWLLRKLRSLFYHPFLRRFF